MTQNEFNEMLRIALNTEFAATPDGGDSVSADIPIVHTLPEGTTMPFVKRENGSAAGYAQIGLDDLANEIAGKIDPEEAFPDKMDAVTQEQFDAIFYPISSSNE